MQALPFVAAGASILKGVGGFMSARHNAKMLKRQAREEQNAGAAQSLRVAEEARRAIGQQLAAQNANGFVGGSGSALDALTESQVNAALDAMTIRRDAAVKAAGLRSEARDQKRQGWFSLAEGLLGAGSSYAGMKDDWTQARRGQTPSPRTTPPPIGGYGDGSNMTGGIRRGY